MWGSEEKRVAGFFAAARNRLDGLTGESRLVTFAATLGMLEFTAQEAGRNGVKLPDDFDYFWREVQQSNVLLLEIQGQGSQVVIRRKRQ